MIALLSLLFATAPAWACSYAPTALPLAENLDDQTLQPGACVRMAYPSRVYLPAYEEWVAPAITLTSTTTGTAYTASNSLACGNLPQVPTDLPNGTYDLEASYTSGLDSASANLAYRLHRIDVAALTPAATDPAQLLNIRRHIVRRLQLHPDSCVSDQVQLPEWTDVEVSLPAAPDNRVGWTAAVNWHDQTRGSSQTLRHILQDQAATITFGFGRMDVGSLANPPTPTVSIDGCPTITIYNDLNEVAWTSSLPCQTVVLDAQTCANGATNPNTALDPVFASIDSDGDGFGQYDDITAVCAITAGWSANHDDCNDQDNAIHPNADEICDGIDNDCTWTADDNAIDAVDLYADADADGYRTDVVVGSGCAPGIGQALQSADIDCDDTNHAISPAATEIPGDTIDQDCDGFDAPIVPIDTDETDDTDATDTDPTDDTDVDAPDTDNTDPIWDSVDTEVTTDTDASVTPTEGCGCASGGADGAWWLALGGVAMLRRRERAPVDPS